jgi:hypothetical protein
MGFYASTGEKDMNGSQCYSYTYSNSPVQGLYVAAGGELDGTEHHQSICFSINIGDECLESIAPYWFVEKKQWMRNGTPQQHPKIHSNQKKRIGFLLQKGP